jgi:predicted solute-binding protein
MGHLGADEARERDDHLLAFGGEALRILQGELRLLDDLIARWQIFFPSWEVMPGV